MKFQPKDYCYYSKVLNKPFDSIDALRAAEAAELEKQEAKAKAAADKKNDASAVEQAYKDLNAAKKRFKEDLKQINARYANDLKKLQMQYDEDRKGVDTALANAEATYQEALKAFTEKYPEGFHITLKDGDYETTIANKTKSTIDNSASAYKTMFDLFFPFI